jgi:hypothetical protein
MENEKKEYITEVTVNMLRCLRCNHTWLPRKLGDRPLTCPDCHSSYWFRPRTREQKPKVVQPNGLDNTLTDNK